jgi:hypothetical protein
MGQYFKPIILGNQPQEGQHESIIAWMHPHEYDNGLKLMEHSYQGNDFVSTFEKQLTPQGNHHKSRVVWTGDYANFEPGLKIIQDGEECEANLFSLLNDENKIKPEIESSEDYNYIVNHTKKLFVDKTKIADIPNSGGDKIHPLPLLTCEGNGRGGGDFRGDEKDLVGSWSRDVISVEQIHPKNMTDTMDFTEIVFDLVEY